MPLKAESVPGIDLPFTADMPAEKFFYIEVAVTLIAEFGYASKNKE